MIKKKVKFDSFEREFIWKSHGLITKLFQVQGIDIRLMQEKEDRYISYCPYSDPAHELFTCLLRYLKDNDVLPKLDDIISINGISAPKRNYAGITNASSLIKYFNEKLPFFEDNKIKVTSINMGRIGAYFSRSFFGYVQDKNFVIGVSADNGLKMVRINDNKEIHLQNIENLITLDQSDALNVIRGIYFFCPHDELLREVYNFKENSLKI